MKVNEEIIDRAIRRIILEYGGISDEIMNMSELIFNEISEQHREYQRRICGDIRSYNDHPIYFKSFRLYYDDSNELANIANEIYVRLYFYDPKTEDYSEFKSFLNENSLLSLAFIPKYNGMRLSFAWPNNDMLDDNAKNDILSSINHEVKHAYQDSKRGGTNISDQYSNAVKERDKKIGYYDYADTPLKKLIDYYIPWIYYRLDKDEMDAWLQEMYIEALHTNDIRQTNTYKNLSETIKNYKEIKEWYYTNDSYYTRQKTKEYIDRSIRRIDTPKNYFNLCDRNMNYLINKMRRVIGRWYEERGIYNGSFKQYSSNEIQPTSPFMKQHPTSPFMKQQRNGIRNILSRFFNRKKR